ncbi:MAG: HI0074 family nucleotidyltransferase substrate-binding subunit [Xanthomonadaceae bacterium]|nr:HI0074 family nucleotidyltransferase substrate-binding subunit [Xanthomonadaceae bacterium]
MALDPSLIELEKALHSLEIALSSEKTELNRDATIQRFEFSVELAWKTARKKLGFQNTAPKLVVRDLAQAGVIQSAEKWFEFIEARYMSSHTYKEDVAEIVYLAAKDFLPHALKLLAELKKI